MLKMSFAAALLGCAAISAPVSALTLVDLTGSTVQASLLFPDASTVYAAAGPAVVGAGVEFAGNSFSPAPQSIDIGARTISLFTNGAGTYSTATFNGFKLDFSGYTGSLNSLRVAATSTFQPVGFSVSGNSVYINLAGQSVNANDVLNIAAVPEPATWGMMIVGFGLVGFAARRRPVAITA